MTEFCFDPLDRGRGVRFTFDGIRAILSSLQYTVERGKICVHLVLFSPILTRKVAGLPVDPFADPPLPFNPSHATRTQELLLSSTVLLYYVFYVSILSRFIHVRVNTS